MMIPIGTNKANITAKVAKYFFRMYLSIIVSILSYLLGWIQNSFKNQGIMGDPFVKGLDVGLQKLGHFIDFLFLAH